MNDDRKITVDEALNVLRADYFSDVRSIADEARELAAKGELADDEALDEWLHESIDGCARVIYTWRAQQVIMLSDNSDAYADELGTDGLVGPSGVNWSGMAYMAMLADVRDLLSDVEFGAESDEDAADAEAV